MTGSVNPEARAAASAAERQFGGPPAPGPPAPGGTAPEAPTPGGGGGAELLVAEEECGLFLVGELLAMAPPANDAAAQGSEA